MAAIKINGKEVQRGENVQMVPPEDLVIVQDPAHPLYEPPEESAEGLEELARNMLHNGQITPVHIWKEGARYLVAAGRRRAKAGILANQILKKEGGMPAFKLKCLVVGGNEVKAKSVSIIENIRKVESPLTLARKAQELINQRGGVSAENIEAVARDFQVTTATIRNYLKIVTLSKPVQDAIDKGLIATHAAVKLADLPATEQKETLKKMIESGAKPTVERVAKAAGKAPSPRLRPFKEVSEQHDLLKDSIFKGNPEAIGFMRALDWVRGDDSKAWIGPEAEKTE